MSIHRTPAAHSGLKGVLYKLHSIKIGGAKDDRISESGVAQLFGTLGLLLENGLSLRRALVTIELDDSLKKHKVILRDIRSQVDTGQSFSAAIAKYPRCFAASIVKQLRVAERSGTMAVALQRIATRLDFNRQLRSRILKQLSYPALVTLAGTGLVIFMMLIVVPQFEQMYGESGAQLPAVTRSVSAASRWICRYGWIVALAVLAAMVAIAHLRRDPRIGARVDGIMLKTPVVGGWLRDVGILQFIDTVNTMVESGFVPVDAISESVGAVCNQAIRGAVKSVRDAVVRGGKLSDELSQHPEIFPPTIGQLIVVGEQTGNLLNATKTVRDYLCRRIETRINAIVAAIEPVLTVALATVIGFVVLAIYMPMFSMFEVLE